MVRQGALFGGFLRGQAEDYINPPQALPETKGI